MIGQLRGLLVVKKPPNLLVDVSGVGYELQASMTTFYQLPKENSPVLLFTHMVCRDDAQLLYGFFEERERAVFKEIIKISGVGPKLALGILSGMDVPTLVTCIEQREITQLVGLPGIGKKTAERLIIEMQSTLSKKLANSTTFSEILLCSANNSKINTAQQEAVSALVALGYKLAEANKVINQVAEQNMDSETLIRLALQRLAK